MTSQDPVVIHVVSAQSSATKLEILRALCESLSTAALGRAQPGLVVQVGSGSLAHDLSPRPRRLSAPLDLGWLGARALRREIDGVFAGSARERVILHVWSAAALGWCLPIAPERGGVLVQTEGDDDLRGLSRWYLSRRHAAGLAFVCPTAIARRRLLELGVSPNHCALIRESVDYATLNVARQSHPRQRWGLRPEESAILVLPPARWTSGACIATWACLLLDKVREGIRVLIPMDGPDRARLERFVDASGRRSITQFVTDGTALPSLLSAADLAVFTPCGDTAVTGVAWAMAAGCPIVASAVPAVAELLAHGHNARLCRPDDPRDAARRMLEALEDPAASRRMADLARVQAFEAFGRQRMLEQYGRLYRNLAGGRRPAEGIDETSLRA